MADLAAAIPTVVVVGPGRLDREGSRPERDVLRGSLTRADPGALVAGLVARAVGPAPGGKLVGDGFGVLVTLHDRDPVERAGRACVDEILTARASGIGNVRKVRERDLPVAGA